VLIGVDLGSASIRTGAVGQDGKLLDFRLESEVVGAAPAKGREVADHLLASVDKMVSEHSRSAPIAAIGVGFPGLVDHSNHRIINLPNAPGLVGLDLFGEFKNRFGVPVYFENNANAAAYAEMTWGAARGESDWMYLHIGAGIGAGLVLDGKVRRGKSGYAGEIGHINIDPEGIECPCGSFGCLETMASASNIVRRTRDRLRRDATSSLSRLGAMGGFTYDDIVAAAESGDDLAKMMLQRTGVFIGRALAGVINLLNLSMVAVGGAPSARPFLVPAIIEETRRRAFAPAFQDCRIVAAELNGEAGVIGAALLAARNIN
ncbi:MAG: ROK family protein, partial [Acidobacteriota bacterium]